MTQDKWVWMPHPGHFICGDDCRFRLNTYVGSYLVSTVGELLSDSRVREILAKSRGVKIEGRGDAWDRDYMAKIGFDDIGCGRKYETMVFKAKKSKQKCCPWEQVDGSSLDFASYNSPEDARKGHMKLCKKWSKK